MGKTDQIRLVAMSLVLVTVTSPPYYEARLGGLVGIQGDRNSPIYGEANGHKAQDMGMASEVTLRAETLATKANLVGSATKAKVQAFSRYLRMPGIHSKLGGK